MNGFDDLASAHLIERARLCCDLDTQHASMRSISRWKFGGSEIGSGWTRPTPDQRPVLGSWALVLGGPMVVIVPSGWDPDHVKEIPVEEYLNTARS
ncbi:MAG: hypothetical protein ABI706_17530 [Ilumatobacteraceae bacterium]